MESLPAKLLRVTSTHTWETSMDRPTGLRRSAQLIASYTVGVTFVLALQLVVDQMELRERAQKLERKFFRIWKASPILALRYLVGLNMGFSKL